MIHRSVKKQHNSFHHKAHNRLIDASISTCYRPKKDH